MRSSLLHYPLSAGIAFSLFAEAENGMGRVSLFRRPAALPDSACSERVTDEGRRSPFRSPTPVGKSQEIRSISHSSPAPYLKVTRTESVVVSGTKVNSFEEVGGGVPFVLL